MYRTCLFCHADLGANEVIEHFPVGRRLAFDAAKGRLWVVCRRCMRWNLTPLDERWEAIEECERIFRDTKLRVSSDNIGMAKVREGLELVRIGPALRPEIAVWRYGAINQARRRRAMAIGVGSTVLGFGSVLALGPALGVSLGFLTWRAGSWASERLRAYLKGEHRPIALPTGDRIMYFPRGAIGNTQIVLTEEDELALRIPHPDQGTIQIAGPSALQRLATLLSAVNRDGVRTQAVEAGERILTDAGDPQSLLRRLASPGAPRPFPRGDADLVLAQQRRQRRHFPDTFRLGSLAEGNRVALEMAANEENERRAMEGELAMLEAAWKEAEEIAAIADDMFLPESVRAWLDRARGR